MGGRILAVIDRDDRATAAEYADLLSFCVGLRLNFGSLDVVLRGAAVSCALALQPPGEPQRLVRGLLRTGVRLWADGTELKRIVQPAQLPIIDGVTCADADAMATTWPEYGNVWFL